MDLLVYQGLNLYLLIFARMIGFFLTAIPFSATYIPHQVKVWLAVMIAFLVFMVNLKAPVQISGTIAGYVLQILGEALIGCILGFITQIVFAAFQLAGQLLDMQIGFGMVNVLDPQSGIQVPLFGNFLYLFALLCFFAVNGHHILLSCIVQSYKILPVGGMVHFSGNFYNYIFGMAGDMFAIAFKLALPVLGSLLIAELVLGIIARTVPQMNIFMVAMPMNIGLGLGLVMVIIPVFVWAFEMQFNQLYQHLSNALMVLRG
jgi:flagellar biosynthetic protein FliR